MLEHQKLILQNVAHDRELFQKELLKSLKWLKPDERNTLIKWLRQHYWDSHKDIIQPLIYNLKASA